MKNLILLICLITLFSASPVLIFGCSILVGQPTKFIPNEYLFVGKVVGFTENFEPEITKSQKDKVLRDGSSSISLEKRLEIFKNSYTSSALVVEVIHSVYSPKKLTETVLVFPFNLKGPCSYRGWRKKDLIKNFPIGSKINVMATESEIFQNKELPQELKLEVRMNQTISPTRILGNEFDSSFSAETDYQSLVEPRKYVGKTNFDFELRKEFVRLEFEKPEDRVKTLERLAYFPDFIGYQYIIKNYLGENDPDSSRLLNLRKRFEEEFLKK